jgi:hypothetical protein
MRKEDSGRESGQKIQRRQDREEREVVKPSISLRTEAVGK